MWLIFIVCQALPWDGLCWKPRSFWKEMAMWYVYLVAEREVCVLPRGRLFQKATSGGVRDFCWGCNSREGDSKTSHKCYLGFPSFPTNSTAQPVINKGWSFIQKATWLILLLSIEMLYSLCFISVVSLLIIMLVLVSTIIEFLKNWSDLLNAGESLYMGWPSDGFQLVVDTGHPFLLM